MTDPLRPDSDDFQAENDTEGLTCIREAYTLASTPEPGSETDLLMINNFLNTLAKVAIAVASRNLREKQEGEE